MTNEQIQQIIGRLAAESSPQERSEALDELRASGAGAVPELVVALRDGDRFVRRTAARVLGDLGAVEAVPALIEAMGYDFVRVRRAALGALIEIGQPTVEQVKAACASQNQRIQRLALTALRRLEIRDAVAQALAALQSDDVPVRREAAKLLLVSDNDGGFEAAVDCLADEDIAGTVAHELIGLGDRGRQILLDAAQGEDPVARRAAAVELAKEGGPEALDMILDSYAEDNLTMWWEAPEVIDAALEAGREVPFEKLLEQASGAGADPDGQPEHAQRPAIKALGRIGDPRAMPVLEELLGSEHKVLGRLAAEALAGIGTDECVELLVELMGHPEAHLRREAAERIRDLRERPLRPVLAALGSENRAQRENAGHVLSCWPDLAVPGILQAAGSENPLERWGALWATNSLARRHPEAVTDEVRRAIIVALDDDDARVRRFAALAEGEVRDEAAIPSLIAHLMDSDRQVRRKCTGALAAMSEPAAAAIVQTVRAADGAGLVDPLGRALGLIGDAGVEAALDLLDDASPVARRTAAWALQWSKDEKALPGLLQIAREDDDELVAPIVWGLSSFFTDEAADALEYIANNENLESSTRRDARGLLKDVRQGQRLEQEEPSGDGEE